MKKWISVLLSAVLLFGMLPMVGAGLANAADYVAYPTVYINGGRSALYETDGTKIAPVTPPDGYVGDAVMDCIGDLGKALLTGSEADTLAYKEKLVSWVAPLYEKIRLDDSGSAVSPIIVGYGSSGYFEIPETLPNRISGGEYPVRAYNYYYDWRLDPFETADELAHYIDLVLAASGRDKVNLVGRCEGGSPLMAYLAAYGHEKIHKIMFYNTASNGYLLPTMLFSGKLSFSTAQIKAFLNNNVHFSMDDLDLSAELMDLLMGLMDLSALSPQFDLAGAALDIAYARVLREVMPDVALASYGTMPAVWAMVAAEDFDDAVNYIFAGKEAQYAGLIEKIRYYHENVQLKSEALLSACEADGIEIGVMAKYGYPAIPLTEEAKELSDGEALVRHLSFGAKVSTHTGTLDEAYIKTHDAKYISPDRKIDASTCLFPDTTWFFGAVDHQSTPWELDDLAQRFFISRVPMDVNTDPAYPQFLVYDVSQDRVVPQTEENADMTCVGLPAAEEEEGSGAASAFDRFMSGILGLFRRFFAFLQTFVDGILAHARGTAA